ncbi:MAG: hypothetical protein J5857_01385 [Treponema sp.]|nr:hypothetical protein [Treponema sp.]
MKLEALFTSKDNSLFTVEGESVSLNAENKITAQENSITLPQANDSPLFIYVPWTLVGLDEESYNEAFLANLRDSLKLMEEKKQFAIIVPAADSAADSPDKKEAFTASMKHCARRIKDCVSVIGFAIPLEADSEYFCDELSQKHSHYVFFSRDENVLSNKSIVRY